jgi:site-specific DNA-cytosine methylase
MAVVEEFKSWGPLLEGGTPPDPKRKGHTFRSFVNALKQHGYEVEWRELRASDYGAPTVRKRFFLVARCDGQPIVWPVSTHGDPKSLDVKTGKLLPLRAAAEIIDWTRPCPSIFKRKKPFRHILPRFLPKYPYSTCCYFNEKLIEQFTIRGFDRTYSIRGVSLMIYNHLFQNTT